MMKNKILCILQLPPPIHGVSQCNINVIKSEIINNCYNLETINLQFAETVTELGNFSFKKFYLAIKYSIKIFKKISYFKPNLVYFTISPNGFSFYRDAFYVLIIKIMGFKILLHLHGQGFNVSPVNNRFKFKVSKMVFKNSEVICLAKKLIKDIENVYFGTPYIVPNGIEIQNNITVDTLNKNNKLPHILYLSHLKKNKGVIILIDALKIIKESGNKFKVRIVGEPADISITYLKDYIKINKLESDVEVIGPLYNMEKYYEYIKADIFVFPTYFDAFGIVNLEAMQFGLPIVTTNEGGISEVVLNDETGFVIEPKNIQELAEKLSILIKDKKLREEFGKKGQKRFFQQFTLLHFEENLKNVFDEILKKEKRTIKNCNF